MAEPIETFAIFRQTVICAVASDHRSKVLPLRLDRQVPVSLAPVVHRFQRAGEATFRRNLTNVPLAARWALRFDGSYLDFGSETYRVNLSGNNSCGPGGAMTPCRYTVRNRLGVVRLGFVYRFGE